eukprot:6710384-Prymnesium_polylepis.1
MGDPRSLPTAPVRSLAPRMARNQRVLCSPRAMELWGAHFKLYISTRGRSLDTPPVRAQGAAAHARARSCG